jgi:hypothetical protein
MLANGFIEMKFPIKPDESGGEPARIPNASRGSRTPGSREASGLRVALAPLSDEQGVTEGLNIPNESTDDNTAKSAETAETQAKSKGGSRCWPTDLLR